MAVTKRNLAAPREKVESARQRILQIMSWSSPKVQLALNDVLELDLNEALTGIQYAEALAE